jgi:ubiquitin-conjugating enzyme E2 M
MNIFSLKKKQQEQQNKVTRSKTTAAQIRIQKDLSDITDLPGSMSISFEDPNDLFNFKLEIKPDDGFYRLGTFTFSIQIPAEYPHAPPKVKCIPKIYHPNIDLDGNVCLNILREDWKPVLNLNAVLVSIY